MDTQTHKSRPGVELKTVPKISVKIWRPIIGKLDEKIDSACLRRDAYLRRVLQVELDYLDAEVSIPNSKASYDYVLATLDQCDRKLVSLALPTELTTRLNDICTRKRIVRDAFFNRLFLLLAAPQKLIDRLYFPDAEGWKWRMEVWSEHRNDGPFFQNVFYPLEPDVDPFWALRMGIAVGTAEDTLEDFDEPESGRTIRVQRDIVTDEVQPASSLYTTIYREKVNKDRVDLLGFSCHLPDRDIPGHPAERHYQEKLDELLDL